VVTEPEAIQQALGWMEPKEEDDKMRHRLVTLVKQAFPVDTWRGRALRYLLGRNPALRRYEAFAITIEPTLWQPPIDAATADPLFSVVVPMFNTPDSYLRPLLDSLINQAFPRFEVILADASTDDTRAAAIGHAAQQDPRLKYLRLPQNSGISANTNAGLAVAKAPYVAFVDHDDVLAPQALNEMAARLLAEPETDILYSDEDALSEDGLKRLRPAFKPIWSPHLFLMCNYTNHLSVIRRELIAEVGGLRPEFDGAQDYDLLLRLHTLGRSLKVAHVPGVLYHWRQAKDSTARAVRAKHYAIEAGRNALEEYLQRVGLKDAQVSDLPIQPSWHRIKVPWQAKVAVVCTGSAARYIDDLQQATRTTVCHPVWLAQPDGIDVTALPAGIEVVTLISWPYQPTEPGWLDDLVGVLALPEATVVAPLLCGPDGTVDSAGFVQDALGITPILRGYPSNGGNLAGLAGVVRDVDAVSPAVLVVKREDLDLVASPTDGLVVVPPGRGHAVVWGFQCMTRGQLLEWDGYISRYIGLGSMGWEA